MTSRSSGLASCRRLLGATTYEFYRKWEMQTFRHMNSGSPSKTKTDKRHFLQMVRDEGYANPDDEGEFEAAGAEALSDLKHLLPLELVFPKEATGKIMASAMMIAVAINVHAPFRLIK